MYQLNSGVGKEMWIKYQEKEEAHGSQDNVVS